MSSATRQKVSLQERKAQIKLSACATWVNDDVEVKNLWVGKDDELVDLHVIDRVIVLTGTKQGRT